MVEPSLLVYYPWWYTPFLMVHLSLILNQLFLWCTHSLMVTLFLMMHPLLDGTSSPRWHTLSMMVQSLLDIYPLYCTHFLMAQPLSIWWCTPKWYCTLSLVAALSLMLHSLINGAPSPCWCTHPLVVHLPTGGALLLDGAPSAPAPWWQNLKIDDAPNPWWSITLW